MAETTPPARSPDSTATSEERTAKSTKEAEQISFIRRALSPDREAIGVLVREFMPIIHRTAVRALFKRSRLGSTLVACEAEDVTQEVLLRLFGSRDSPLVAWEPERGSLANFVRMITYYEVCDVLRRERNNPMFSQATELARLDEATHPEAPPDRLAMLRQELRTVMDRAQYMLSPKGFEMFLHLWIDAKPVGDICRTTGQSPASVYQWRRRIQQLLRTVGPVG